MERAVSAIKAGEEPVTVDLGSGTLTERGEAVVRAVSEGELTSSPGAALHSLLLGQLNVSSLCLEALNVRATGRDRVVVVGAVMEHSHWSVDQVDALGIDPWLIRQELQRAIGVEDHRKAAEHELIDVGVHDPAAGETVDDERSHAESVVVGFPVRDIGRNAIGPVQEHGDRDLAGPGGQAQDLSSFGPSTLKPP